MLQTCLAAVLAASLLGLFLVISREDNATGKIRNKLILLGFMLLGATLALLALQSAVNTAFAAALLPPHLAGVFFTGYLLHACIAAAAAIALWKGGAWPAGDAKMFILAAMALPLIAPRSANFPRLLFLSLLMNVFIPAGVFFAAEAAAGALRRLYAESGGRAGAALLVRARAAFTAMEDKTGKAGAFVALTLLFAGVRFMKDAYRGPFHISEPLFFALMMLLWPALSSLFKAGGRVILCCAAAGALGAAFHPLGRLLLVNAAYGLTRSLPFTVFNQLLRGLMNRDTLTAPLPGALALGTILTEKYYLRLKQAFPDFYSDNFGTVYPDGLTAGQAERLKALLARPEAAEKGLLPVEARSGQPFAAWIAAGTALTLLLNGGTVLDLCKSLMRAINV